MKKYYTTSKGKDSFTAGIKAPDDICILLEKRGYESIDFSEGNKTQKNIVKKIRRFLNWIKLGLTVEKDSLIVMQYPYNITNQANYFIPKLQRKKGIKFVLVLHDIDSFRAYNVANSKKTENVIIKADYLICHNEIMKQKLIENGIEEERLYVLGIFDYLIDGFSEKKRTDDHRSVIIAGNLGERKSPYIYKLLNEDRNYQINLYGPNYSMKEGYDRVSYKGVYKPDELPSRLDGAFGLVWDGDSIETCAGPTGKYLRINNPHKASLYIVARIPLIVWKESAIAKYVREKKVGIVISSLKEIDELLSTIDSLQYEKYLSNIKSESEKLANGYYFNTVIGLVEKSIGRE